MNLTSFCLLSTCSVSGWMTMTRHPLITIYIPLWINEDVSALQNKKENGGINSMEWNSCLARLGCAAKVWNEMWQRLLEPRWCGDSIYMWQSLHAVSTVVGFQLQPQCLASLMQHLPGAVFWLLSLHMGKINAKTNRGQTTAERKIYTRNLHFSKKLVTQPCLPEGSVKWTHVYLKNASLALFWKVWLMQ